jgi:inosose dehydratase
MVTRRKFLSAAIAGRALIEATLKGRATDVADGAHASDLVGRRFSVANADAAGIRYGYAAITWGANIEQAMEEIAAVGFRGIQLRSEAFQQFGDRAAALRDLLQRRQLAFAALSSGNLSIDPAREQAELAAHVQHARFLRAAGGTYLQIIDERPKGRAIVPDDYKRLGRLLTTLGRRVKDEGVTMVYHHHMNSLGEHPHEVAPILDAADPKYVRLLLDVAHYQQGGGDPVEAIRRYREWIQVVHLKDVRSTGAGGEYQFVELGRGRVNLPAVSAALAEINFGDWAIVELDRVPDPGGTPKQSAEANRRYLIETLHAKV